MRTAPPWPELPFGHGPEYGDFAYLHFTDDFAAGIVSDGKLLRGGHGIADEVGRLFAISGLTRPTLESLRKRLVAGGHDFPDLHPMLGHYDPAWRQVDARGIAP